MVGPSATVSCGGGAAQLVPLGETAVVAVSGAELSCVVTDAAGGVAVLEIHSSCSHPLNLGDQVRTVACTVKSCYNIDFE